MNPMELFNQVKEMIERKISKLLKSLSMKTKMIWASTSTKLNLLCQVTKWSVAL